jgi:cellulose synthase (UDP-forming)
VLEATLVGCREIRGPHVTWVLDDGRRPEVQALATRLGVRYLTREDNRHAKAGNINAALPRTHGDLILFLDADHVPMPDILEATLGYFDDPEVALVQTPHDFFNRDSVQHTRAARHEQTLFYDVIACGKDRHNAMFWCGSATVIRRAALEAVGGVLTHTVAEDFHTTIAMHARGWRTRYHNETLVQGLAPHDLAGFLLQRARWARGNLRVFRTAENPLTCRGLTPRQRTSYFASLFGYFSGLQRLALLVVLVWTLTTARLPMHASVLTLGVLWLPWVLFGLLATSALGRGALGPFDSTRYGLLTMGIHVRATLELVVARTTSFLVTPKDGIDEGGLAVIRSLRLLTVLAGAIAVAWCLRVAAALGLVDGFGSMPDLALGVVLALGVWEFACITIVLGTLVRRRQLRHTYRVPVGQQARIAGTATVVPLRDLTPEGMSFESAIAIEPGTLLVLLTRLLTATGDRRDVALPVEVRRIRRVGGSYQVGVRFRELDPATHDALVEYCYVVTSAQRHGRSPIPEPADAGVADAEPVAAS